MGLNDLSRLLSYDSAVAYTVNHSHNWPYPRARTESAEGERESARSGKETRRNTEEAEDFGARMGRGMRRMKKQG